MALMGTSWRILVFFLLVVSVQITFATAWSCAIAPPLPRFECKGRVFTKNIVGEKKNSQVTVIHCREVSPAPNKMCQVSEIKRFYSRFNVRDEVASFS